MAARRPAQRLAAHLASPSTRISQSQFTSTRRWLSSSTGSRASRTASSSNFSPLWLAAVALGVAAPVAYKMIDMEPLRLDPSALADRDAQKKRESGVSEDSPMRLRMEKFIREQQAIIVAELERLDGKKFRKDEWERPNGGGGTTCVLQEGNVFEKAGLGVSVVYGSLPKPAIEKMRANHKTLDPNVESLDFFAAGLSMVLHPRNPMAPTVHLNYRYFETANPDGTSAAWWFGGGTDLTPSYLFDEDAIHFHKTLKTACDAHDKDYYPRFKKWCDEYFYNKHRGECRGIGGIFFDDLDDSERDRENTFAFIQDCLKSFLPGYVPIIEKRKDMPFTEQEKDWQQLRRGKYVEFNLVHDRGTAFGLNTPGSRVESILMSLPLTASWKYMHEPEPKSREQRLVEVLKDPKDRHHTSIISPWRHNLFLSINHATRALRNKAMEPLPSHRQLLTALITSISDIAPPPASSTDDSTALGSIPPSQRPRLLTLHVLFPNLVLPALDLLDRGLVTRLKRPDADAPSSRGDDSFLVRSLATTLARRGRDFGLSSKRYIVHLDAWNCSCASFTFDAFPSHPAPAAEQSRPPLPRHEDWSFGGMSLDARGDAPPCCKHLLACLLVDKWPGMVGGHIEQAIMKHNENRQDHGGA
ncbi:hypothetical protein FZEAL_2476 [Fusarium zealandicum]|uniref:coproporphyrinogen oxidase n=1 Tax=Fusarium zealandicum TaxID=1053134 RepID=A0A8H4UQQ1_9HYPO|nr:hypothetical protein FZEAL_2476 [Fusarium zealandicum]